jgi:hypothetical protein
MGQTLAAGSGKADAAVTQVNDSLAEARGLRQLRVR